MLYPIRLVFCRVPLVVLLASAGVGPSAVGQYPALTTSTEPTQVWQIPNILRPLDGSHRSIILRQPHVQPASVEAYVLPLVPETDRGHGPESTPATGTARGSSGSSPLSELAGATEMEFDWLLLSHGGAPVGTPDLYAVATDQTLTIAAPGFLANDLDLEGEAITAVSIDDNVDHGTLAAFPSGSFTYTPDLGFIGTDTFVYRMRDASNNVSDPVLVIIEVLPAANRVPIGMTDAYAVLRDATLSIAAPGFLGNDIDLDGEVLTAVSVDDNVDHGSLAAFPSGSFTYTPDPGFSGTDTFVYRIRDASNNISEPVTVTIDVYAGNRAPIGVDDAYAARIDTPLMIAAPGFLANDVDLDGEAITAVSIDDNVDHGTLAAFPSGTFTYTPNPGFTGTDTFVYRMRDASQNLSKPVTVVIEVFAAGDVPVGTPDHYIVASDRILSIAAPGFLANDIDLNGEALTAVSIDDNVDHGILAAFPSGNFTYTPDPGYTGTDSFVYRMRDASNNVSDPILVTIEVLPAANRVPIGTADLYSMLSDTTLLIGAPGFLANDIDLDGEALTAVSVDDNVDYGSLAAFPSGTFAYTPDAGFAGTDSFTYRMRDASGHVSDPVTVTIEVFAGNRVPIGVDDAYAARMNTPLSIAAPGFLANDIDLDGEAITAVSVDDNVDHGTLAAFPSGTFTYTPDFGFSGSDRFTYRMRDASNNVSEPVTVIITVIDPDHGCIDDLKARAKSGKIQLTWTHTGAHQYNVYRSTVSGGPYVKLAATSSVYSTYLDESVVNGITYYYVVREANLLDEEKCESNQASAQPRAR
jgi:hypothetical protein